MQLEASDVVPEVEDQQLALSMQLVSIVVEQQDRIKDLEDDLRDKNGLLNQLHLLAHDPSPEDSAAGESEDREDESSFLELLNAPL